MHTVSVTVLGSGSCGNSILVSSEDTVMIDAGLSCKELERRMSIVGADPSRVDAVFLTHEHTDHTRGALRFCSKYGVPVHGTDGTLSLTPLNGVRAVPISTRHAVTIGSVMAKPFPVRHFAAEPVAFTIEVHGKKVSIASDLGSVTPRVVDEMGSADLMLVEANYDDDMLMNGSYPDFLKRTIRSDHGHLSNKDAGMLASKTASEKTKRVVLLHLSKENNTPGKAREAVEKGLRHGDHRPEIEVTEHGGMNGPFALR